MVGIGVWKKFTNIAFLETYTSKKEYENNQQVKVPLESLIAYCVFRFCSPRRLALRFVTIDRDAGDYEASAVTISAEGLDIIWTLDVPGPVISCQYPVVLYQHVILCGLCAVVRHICMYRHGPLARDEHEDGLLGFRQSCLQAPNETSVWTKYCEIELINTVRELLTAEQIKSVPINLVRFENHLRKPVKIHNMYKVARELRNNILSPVDEENSISQSSESDSSDKSSKPNAEECTTPVIMGSKEREESEGSVSKEKGESSAAVTSCKGAIPKVREGKSAKQAKKIKAAPKATGPNPEKSDTDTTTSEENESGAEVKKPTAEPKSTGAVPKMTRSKSTGSLPKARRSDSRTTGSKAGETRSKSRESQEKQSSAGTSTPTTETVAEEKESVITATVSEAIESVTSLIYSAFSFIEGKVSKIGTDNKNSEKGATAIVTEVIKTGAIPKVPRDKERVTKDNERVPKNRKWKSKNKKETLIDPSGNVSELMVAHTFAEGPFLTVADLVLLPSFHIAIQSFGENKYQSLFPFTYKWYKKVMTIPALEDIYPAVFGTMPLKQLMFDEIVVPQIENVSLYKSDPKRHNPKKRLFTKPAEIQEALSYITPGMELTMKELNLGFTFNWNEVPDCINPAGGLLPDDRVVRKTQQLQNIITTVISIVKEGDVIVDFCSGCGHLGVLLAHMLPHCKVILVENKEEALFRARNRATCLNLKNCLFYQCNLDFFNAKFDLGIGLHACGVATDLILDKCLQNRAKFVLTPCCYGSIHATDRIKYPRSKKFSHVPIDKYLCLTHTADQTHEHSPLAGRGARCMIVIDSDRGRFAEENKYEVTLSRLKPPTCTPKNNLLIGIPQDKNRSKNKDH